MLPGFANINFFAAEVLRSGSKTSGLYNNLASLFYPSCLEMSFKTRQNDNNPPKTQTLHLVTDSSQSPELESGLKGKCWEAWTSSALFSTCDFWAVLLLEEDWEVGSTTFFLCPKINPKSYYQEKEEEKKSFCLAFCCSGHKQQPGIKGVWVRRVSSPPGFLPVNILSAVLAQDIVASVRQRHGFRWSGLPHCSLWARPPILIPQAWKILAHSCLRYLDLSPWLSG